ncbi:hypothetical protein [Cardinium endosymbiont of Tipula unca]|uniref:hypothetical protein n=1 Tax=Cardinium endosymbiont of Tipula unca TaxID=3066216 RepID=UPI0030CDBECB
MKDTVANLNKVKLYSILMLSMVVCMACKSNAPQEEPYKHDNHVVFGTASAALPVKDQHSKYQKVTGIDTSETGCIEAILQVVARLYKKEIDAGGNPLLKKIVHGLTADNSNRVQIQEVVRDFSRLPLIFRTSGSADMLLKSIHDMVPCLGKITYSAHYIPDENNNLPLMPAMGSAATVSEQQVVLKVRPILGQDNQVCSPTSNNLSQLIRVNQAQVHFKKHTYHDPISGMQHEIQMKGMEKIVFKQLPDKLCLSFTRAVACMENAVLWDNRDLIGTASIHITHDPFSLNSAISHFDLEAFLVALLDKSGVQHFVSFVQSDSQWYCVNGDKVTSMSPEEAIVASQQGVLFFYCKK